MAGKRLLLCWKCLPLSRAGGAGKSGGSGHGHLHRLHDSDGGNGGGVDLGRGGGWRRSRRCRRCRGCRGRRGWRGGRARLPFPVAGTGPLARRRRRRRQRGWRRRRRLFEPQLACWIRVAGAVSRSSGARGLEAAESRQVVERVHLSQSELRYAVFYSLCTEGWRKVVADHDSVCHAAVGGIGGGAPDHRRCQLAELPLSVAEPICQHLFDESFSSDILHHRIIRHSLLRGKLSLVAYCIGSRLSYRRLELLFIQRKRVVVVWCGC